MTFRRFGLATIVVLIVAAAAGVVVLKRVGLAADRQPNRVESFVARHLVQLAIPSDLASAASPVAGDPEAWRAGADNFKGRCAVCHGADGRGRTDVGPKMYPPVPDLASAEIQQFSDGQLFAIIRHGVSWTGMPAFRSTLGDEDIWRLVAYVRQAPKLTSEEVEKMNAAASGQAADIVMDGTQFRPGDLTVSVGQTVRWRNDDPFPHNVESPAGGFRSGDLESGTGWQFKLTERGTFPYECPLHPGMKGVIKVR
jgi:plastocyanin